MERVCYSNFTGYREKLLDQFFEGLPENAVMQSHIGFLLFKELFLVLRSWRIKIGNFNRVKFKNKLKKV